MKVLLVDDSAMISRIFSGLLGELKGVELVGVVEDVPAAINAITAEQPDVVILDIRLSGGSGMDVLSRMREKHLEPTVIVLTNFPYPEYRKLSLEAGADYFFDKSYEFHKVFMVLRQLCQA